ncbi:Pr6Pr family membrane protein [Membranihabitans marinus]|uniref:Pr6Pr family membrane protein n=1 Tax=Membranihabitans marinus TaxID=1227546 RepID=UPI001EFFCF9E|nr:Pr6Pr family membrane protein [Membranihabitans marinus]
MKHKFEILGLCIAWFAILAQFVVMVQNRQAEMLETILRFFGFFTIQTNILVALFFTVSAFNITRPPFKVLLTKGSITALTAFILIVGSVYQIVLRSIWEPTGLQYVVDELLHTVIPLYMLGYWIFNVEKQDLPLKKVLNWLLYPLIYLVFVIARGSLSGFYPYPFLNIDEIGFEKALGNIAIIFVLALVLLATLSWGGKIIIKNRSTK